MKTGKEEGSEREEGVRGGVKLYHHIVLCCCSPSSVWGEGLFPSSTSLVSTIMMRKRRLRSVLVKASEAGGSPQQP